MGGQHEASARGQGPWSLRHSGLSQAASGPVGAAATAASTSSWKPAGHARALVALHDTWPPAKTSKALPPWGSAAANKVVFTTRSAAALSE
jgi:hypothetical protein